MPNPVPPTPSVRPICQFFYVCGGCDMQDVAYADQLAYKDSYLQTLFADVPGASEAWLKFTGSSDEYPVYFRNKIRFGFVMDEGRIKPSRHAKGSEAADIPVDACYLQSPLSEKLMLWVADFANNNGWQLYDAHTDTGWLKHLLVRQGKHTGETLISLVTTDAPIESDQRFIAEILSTFPELTCIYQTKTCGKNNEDPTDTLLWGSPTIRERVGDYTFEISPHAFFQTNSAMVERLYDAVLSVAQLKTDHILWDVYAGSATIGIYLSSSCHTVISIESNPQNIADARANIALNGVGNVEIYSGTVESTWTSAFLRSVPKADVIVVDPPRAGLSQTVKNIMPNLGKHRLVYVSCNPATCRRDCLDLIARGYKITSIQGIDMFPHTYHCEMIVALEAR